MNLPLPLITVAGTPRECGVAYGAAAADLIVANTANYMARFASVAGIDGPAARRYGAQFRTIAHEYAPRVAGMLDGVAEGSGVPVDEIYALNARTELIYSTAPEAAECTAIGVL